MIIINITPKLAIRLSAYGAMLFAFGLIIVTALRSESEHGSNPGTGWLLSGLELTAAYFATLLLHEGVHGFFFKLFGGHPKYGAGRVAWVLPYFYATSAGDPFTLFQMTVIGLAPFVVLSTASLALMLLVPAWSAVAATAFVTNLSGAVGDLWFVAQIFRFRHCRDLRLIDLQSGIAIYSSDPGAKTIADRFPVDRTGPLSRLVMRWCLASAILFTSMLPVAIAVDLLHKGNTTIGPSWFPLFSVISVEGQEFGISFSYTAILAAGLLLALLLVPFDLFKRKRHDDSGAGTAPHPVFL